MQGKRVLLIVGGGIAAYKVCELIRMWRRAEVGVTCVLTAGGAQFVTPLTLAALSDSPVYEALFDLGREVEMGHIQLSRQADLVVVCPATADLLARMVAGIADDLATTLLLATDKPVVAVPAMNVRMWQHAATVANVATLRARGVTVVEPAVGAMACGEFGPGRLPAQDEIFAVVGGMLGGELGAPAAGAGPGEVSPPVPGAVPARPGKVPPVPGAGPAPRASDTVTGGPDASPGASCALPGALAGRHVLVTAGPTHEPIDPVRYLANRSSGKQGYAIAAAAAAAGARVTLVSGPVALAAPAGVAVVRVETALAMAAAVEDVLGAGPVDAAVMVAAVADWRPTIDGAGAGASKIKKDGSGVAPVLALVENPDILARVCADARRPRLVIGFAAETDDVLTHAAAKRVRKGADWIIANDVSGDVMGGERNAVHIVTAAGIEALAEGPKEAVAAAIIERMARELA